MLLALIERSISLFCAAGLDCVSWEDAFDGLLTDSGVQDSHHISTTSHTGAATEEVLAFARAWPIEGSKDGELIEVHGQAE